MMIHTVMDIRRRDQLQERISVSELCGANQVDPFFTAQDGYSMSM